MNLQIYMISFLKAEVLKPEVFLDDSKLTYVLRQKIGVVNRKCDNTPCVKETRPTYKYLQK